MSTSRKTVCHFTSVHQHDDVRIFHKQCLTLSKNGFVVHIVAPEAPDLLVGSIRLHGVRGRHQSRLLRMISTMVKTGWVAWKLDADVYHFHDPELIPAGLLLKLLKKRVLYDVHEDYPEDILTKEWIPQHLRKRVSHLFNTLEQWAARQFDGVIAATPAIAQKFKAPVRCVTINNYPLVDENLAFGLNEAGEKQFVCYVGLISRIRGIVPLVEALSYAKIPLALVGAFAPPELRNEVTRLEGWHYVRDYGYLSRTDAAAVMKRSLAGIVTFLPGPNHGQSQPNKMFEYMAAGLPIIASNFPLWRELIEGNQCGICVDPSDPWAIADALQRLAADPAMARTMGANGTKAVFSRYNWEKEAEKLLILYRSV